MAVISGPMGEKLWQPDRVKSRKPVLQDLDLQHLYSHLLAKSIDVFSS
jgi:hypothetical protein